MTWKRDEEEEEESGGREDEEKLRSCGAERECIMNFGLECIMNFGLDLEKMLFRFCFMKNKK